MSKFISVSFFLLIIICIFSSYTLNAQISEGTWLVGGSGSFKTSKEKKISTDNVIDFNSHRIEITGTVGYFIIDKLAFGINPSLVYQKGTFTSGSFGNASYGIGPFIRYYLLQADKDFNFLLDLSYWYQSLKPPVETPANDHVHNISLMVGPELFLNSSLGIEFLVGYLISDRKKGNELGFDSNRRSFLASVGFQFHLKK